jgi:hypothetical protein
MDMVWDSDLNTAAIDGLTMQSYYDLPSVRRINVSRNLVNKKEIISLYAYKIYAVCK